MPEVTRFHGIVITMYYETGRHRLPHFHAQYGRHKASYSINPPALLAGSLPRRQHHLVLAWAELRLEELMMNWHLVEDELRLNKIDGL